MHTSREPNGVCIMLQTKSPGEYDLLLRRAMLRARRCGMKVIIQQNIRKTKRLLVWYAGEVVTFEYRGFIIDIGVFSDVNGDVKGTVLKSGTLVRYFDSSSDGLFKDLLKQYFSCDASVCAALSEYSNPAKTKSRTVILVDALPQAEVSIYDIKNDRYVSNYFLGPASQTTVLDVVSLSASFRKVIDDYADSGNKINNVPAVSTGDTRM